MGQPALKKSTAYYYPFLVSVALSVLFVTGHFFDLSTKYISLYMIIEFLGIFMSFSIALILWYTYDYSEGFLQILGSSFLTIGFLKLFHALSFPGMPQLITINSESKTMLLWLLSRLFESGALLLSSLVVARDYKISFPRWLSFGIALTVSGITLFGVSYGITFFTSFPLSKNTLIQSIFIVAILLTAMILFWLGSKKPLEKNFIFLISGMIAGIFAEVALSYHSTPEDNFNLLGHIYKLVFYAFTFHALFGHTVRKPFHDREKMLNQTVSAISRALDRRDKYTFNHSVRVAEYACVIGGVMQADKKFIDSLRLSGLLHDIGKIAIPDCVLNKEGILTEEEREMIKLHTLRGTEILEPVDQLQLLRGISEHHERVDGKGYPFGKTFNEISLEARILAVADTFDAITSNRIYRPKKNKKEAIQILLHAADTQLDRTVVNAFIDADKLGLIDPIMEK